MRSAIAAVVLAAALGFGAVDLRDAARSTWRMHRYFENLKTINAPVTSLERLILSFVLAHTPEMPRKKS